MTAAIGCGVGERVWTAVAIRGCVDKGAIGRDDHGSVRRGGVCGNGKAATDVVGQHGRAVQRGVRRGGRCVADGNRVHRDVDRCGRGLAAGVSSRVRERVCTAVTTGWRVGVGAVRGYDHRPVSGRSIRRYRESRTTIVAQHGTAAESRVCVG